MSDVFTQSTTDETEITAWLRLTECPGIGNETTRRLLAAYGSPQAVFEASNTSLREHISEEIIRNLKAPIEQKCHDLVERTFKWLQQPNRYFMTLGDLSYPSQFLNLYDPPAIIYAMGNLNVLHGPALAIVGTRDASTQGMRDAEEFAAVLAKAGLTIVSGLANGIDTAAHNGALRALSHGTAASTIAVIGTGCDIVYPARNRDLAHRIVEHGLILSECALGTPAKTHNFPRRNRLIAGLSRGVLVVEAALKSGSLITARLAAEQGLEVFAIPGSIHTPLAKGCHQLIRQGAKLVETAYDVLDELGNLPSITPPIKSFSTEIHTTKKNRQNKTTSTSQLPSMPNENIELDSLLSHLNDLPQDSDTLAAQSGLDTATLQGQLLLLELNGQIERLPGDRYRRLY